MTGVEKAEAGAIGMPGALGDTAGAGAAAVAVAAEAVVARPELRRTLCGRSWACAACLAIWSATTSSGSSEGDSTPAVPTCPREPSSASGGRPGDASASAWRSATARLPPPRLVRQC